MIDPLFVLYTFALLAADRRRARTGGGGVMNGDKQHTPPAIIQGTLVVQTGEPLEFRSQKWVTLIPVNEADRRIWEFSLTTGALHLVEDGRSDA